MNFHRNHWLLLGTIFFGFIFLAIIIAIGPAYWVQAKIQVQPGQKPLSPLQQKGLEVYISEGCVACHTQQVRPIAMDRVWGRPSARRDYTNLGGAMDVWRPYTPAVLGSARIGPDLSDVGSRQPSELWQYMHLYNPRSVVSESIMPAYPWLFRATASPGDDTVVPVPQRYAPGKAKVVPNERGKALVAYLLSLKQPAKSQAGASQTSQAATKPAAGGNKPQASGSAPQANGDTLYANNCASCHQANGAGLAGAFPALAGNEAVIADDPAMHIDTVLNGAQGRVIDGQTYNAPMPAFGGRFSDDEIAAIINHERTSWGNNAPTVTAEDIARHRADGE